MATAEFLTDQPKGATAYQFEPGISTPVLTAPRCCLLSNSSRNQPPEA